MKRADRLMEEGKKRVKKKLKGETAGLESDEKRKLKIEAKKRK